MKSNLRIRRNVAKLLGPLLLVASLAWPRPARAHGPDSVDGLIAFGVGCTASGAFAIGGAVTGIHNGVVAGQGKQLTKGWQGAGYTFGVLNIVGSLAWLTVGITYAADGGGGLRDIGLSFAATHAVVGGVGLGMTAWGARAPGESRVMMVPAPVRDVSGNVVPGIGIAGVGF